MNLHRFSRRPAKKVLRTLSFCIPLFIATVSALGQFNRGVTLEGRVRTNQGQTVPGGASIRLQTSEGMEVGTQFTTSNGEFSIPELRKAVYTITVTAKGFQTYHATLDLTDVANSYETNIELSPAPLGVPAGGGILSRSDEEAPGKARNESKKGVQALEKRKFANAKAHFERALAVDPCYARAQANLALVLEQQHDMTGAVALLRKSLKCDPDFLESYIELGQFLTAQHKFGESEAVLQQGVRLSPSAWQFYYELGLADFGGGNYHAAETNLLKAKFFNHSPPPELYVKLADLYVRERAFPDAYGAMQAYLRAAPRGRYAARTKSIMRQMEAAGVVSKSQTTKAGK